MAELVIPGAGVTPPDKVADRVTSLFAGDSAFDSGSALGIGVDTPQLIGV